MPPSLPQGLVDGVAGFGDAFLIPELIRDAAGIGGVNKCSPQYVGGKIVGFVWGTIPFAARGAAMLGGTRLGHSLNHNRFFRIGPGRVGGPMLPRVSSPYLPGDGHYPLITRLPPLPPIGGPTSDDYCGCK